LFKPLLAFFSQLEREQVGERTKAILQFKKLKGEKVGQVPFGFTELDGKLIKNRAEQNTLKLINKLRDEDNCTFEKIAERLIKLKRKNKFGNVVWNKGMVCRYYRKAS
jgi:DNA invertase Pin-like site-specific DNA recombinase